MGVEVGKDRWGERGKRGVAGGGGGGWRWWWKKGEGRVHGDQRAMFQVIVGGKWRGQAKAVCGLAPAESRRGKRSIKKRRRKKEKKRKRKKEKERK